MKTDIKKAIFLNKTNILEVILNRNNHSFVLDKIAKHLDNGAKIIILTNQDISDFDFLEIAIKTRQLCSIFEALLVISNRADITKLANADGVLSDNSSIPKDKLSKILPDEALFGSREPVEGFDFYVSDKNISNKNKIIFSKKEEKDDSIFYKRLKI